MANKIPPHYPLCTNFVNLTLKHPAALTELEVLTKFKMLNNHMHIVKRFSPVLTTWHHVTATYHFIAPNRKSDTHHPPDYFIAAGQALPMTLSLPFDLPEPLSNN